MKYRLIFPDGTTLSGFEWSAMGAYYRFFPDSGIHSAQINSLLFTHSALEAAGIQIERELASIQELKRPPQFIAIHCSINQGARTIARAISKTMAKRVANALNHHKLNSEGV